MTDGTAAPAGLRATSQGLPRSNVEAPPSSLADAGATPRTRALLLDAALPVGVWLFSRQGGLLQSNGLGRELIGLHSQTECSTAELVDALGEAGAAALRHALQALGPHPQGSVLTLHPRGTGAAVLHLVLRAHPDDDDQVVVALSDGGERPGTDAAQRSKSTFLARMSHDLRTPLNAVMGFSSLLAMDSTVQQSAAALRQLQHIHQAGRHLLAMIDDLLDLERFETGVLQLRLRPVSLLPLATECLALAAPQAAGQHLRLGHHLPAAPMWVQADPTRLRQVLMNLLSNAIKYNQEGGSVHLDVMPRGTDVEVVVRDSGRGMTPQQLAGLFQPFNRLGAEHSGIEGTGLGLVIARQLVEGMGGRIEVHSVPGQGSAFSVLLRPAAAPATEAPAVTAAVAGALPSAAAPPASTTLRVLYVEDKNTNIELMRSAMAQREGVDLEVATSAGAALWAALGRRPDLLLLDMSLPDATGTELLVRLRIHAGLAAVPCVAVSANGTPEAIRAALRSGFDDYIVKPYAIERLLALVDQARERLSAAALGPASAG